MSDIKIGSEWIWTNADGEVVVEVIDVATNEHGETIVTTEEDDGEIQYDDIDYFLANYKPKADMVNHPPHYKDASGIECIEVTQHMRFCEGNSFKYVYRAGSKGNLIEDLKKAAWYAERSWNRSRSGNDRIHWLVQRRGEAIADSRDKQGKTFIAEVMRNIVNSRWWQAYDMLMTEIERLESE